MRILIHGTNESGNYADRILSALSTTCLTKYGRKCLVLQLNSKHPIEEVMVGRDKATTDIKGEFTFKDSGMDALWKRVRTGGVSEQEFSDCCKNISKQENGLDVAEVSENANFRNTVFSQIEFFEKLVVAAEDVYKVVFIFVDNDDTEMIEKLREETITGSPFIDKEIICVSQGPKEDISVNSNTYLAVKNFDFNSEFTVKNMSSDYGTKNIFPIPYNIGFKDACLKKDAIRFLSLNVSPEEADDNLTFSENISKFVGILLGIEEPVTKEKMFVFKK